VTVVQGREGGATAAHVGHLLVVEDDADLREVISGALSADGHQVTEAADGRAALDALAAARFDLVVLDIGLGSGPDGVDVCRRMRAAGLSDVHVLMLTARDTEADVVLALEAGADDYVTKPVGLAELRSRVRAVLRRFPPASASEPAPVLRAGPVQLDPERRTAHVCENELVLTFSEFEVLRALLAAGGRLLSRRDLLRAIFRDDAFRDPRAIDVHVHHLREKLGAAGAPADLIATVRGAGYRLPR
jgi:DNA-binding response OmpR family regulator